MWQPISPTAGLLGGRDPEPNALGRLELALDWTWVSDALSWGEELESTVNSAKVEMGMVTGGKAEADSKG